MNQAAPRFSFVMVVDQDTISSYLTELVLRREKLAESIQRFDSAETALAFLSQSCFTASLASRNCPDLVLLGVRLPGMDGFAFLEALKEENQSQFIEDSVVILTCSVLERDKERAKAYRVRGFLVKPLTETSILQLLNF